jgi:hypothetical protein
MLLHDGPSAARSGDRAVVLHVLPALLAELGRRGLAAEPLPREAPAR